MSVGQGAAHVQSNYGQRRGQRFRNEGKEHNIPWRIKFLSCCIVDILTDDVTRLGAVDCEKSDQSQSGSASRHTTRALPFSHTRSLTPTTCTNVASPTLEIKGQRWCLLNRFDSRDSCTTGCKAGPTAQSPLLGESESRRPTPVGGCLEIGGFELATVSSDSVSPTRAHEGVVRLKTGQCREMIGGTRAPEAARSRSRARARSGSRRGGGGGIWGLPDVGGKESLEETALLGKAECSGRGSAREASLLSAGASDGRSESQW